MKNHALITILICASTNAGAAGPVIEIQDVARFYKVYDAADGHPSADQLQRDYIDPGSDGLHQFAKLRNFSGATIAANLTRHPEIYADAKQCLVVLPAVRRRLQGALRKLRQLYPEARFPPVTIAVGRGKPVGVGSPVSGVQIGLEALCATSFLNPNLEDRFVHVIAHEYVHVQQTQALVDDEHPTVLEGSLIEGAAEFAGELISGQVSYSQLAAMAKGREQEIESRFVPDEDKTDLSAWLYNSTPERPADLGYWVGYRIVKSYYQHSTDKRQALREILQMSDPKEFLAKSGWYPGSEPSSIAQPKENCDFPAPLHQHRDIATIETLELEWSRAYLRGDTHFEECLLTTDFAEIMRNGDVKHLPDELALAEKNKANPLPMGEIPKGTVLLHGNVAVAYGRSQSANGARAMRYADYYVWEDGRWRAYFAQQTEIVPTPDSVR
jgi:hypothetical protein